MARPTPVATMTYAAYLALEDTSDMRHEYLDGNVFAMAGGTPEHAALAMSVGRALANAAQGKPCRVFSADLRVRIEATGLSTYPDVTVVCDKLETSNEDPSAATNPVVVVEVLSETTEAYDRGAKASHYRRIPSLRELVFVSQDEPRIEVYRRNERSNWELVAEARNGEQAEVISLGAILDVDTVYENPLAS